MTCASLSARRAWIEISFTRFRKKQKDVALRKESVDRNKYMVGEHLRTKRSLSARRAWIEIITSQGSIRVMESLSARRAWIEIMSDGFFYE